MVAPHERGPESLEPALFREHTEESPVPNCSDCPLHLLLADYLLTGVGPFVITQEKQEILRRILTTSPDLGAFSIAMFNAGVCPISVLRKAHVQEVATSIDVGLCRTFDVLHRPGIQLHEE